MDIPQFIHLTVGRYFGCFQFGVIMNKVPTFVSRDCVDIKFPFSWINTYKWKYLLLYATQVPLTSWAIFLVVNGKGGGESERLSRRCCLGEGKLPAPALTLYSLHIIFPLLGRIFLAPLGKVVVVICIFQEYYSHSIMKLCELSFSTSSLSLPLWRAGVTSHSSF